VRRPARLHLQELHARITPVAGALDPTFSGDGRLLAGVPGFSAHAAEHVFVQPDGRLVATGWVRDATTRPAVFRFNADGTPDTSFSGDGVAVFNVPAGLGYFYSAARQPDGKIVAAGTAEFAAGPQVLLVRLTADGTPDASFGGGDGLALADPSPGDDNGFAVALQADGKIVVAGNTQVQIGLSTKRMLAVRFAADGTVDPAFGTAGVARVDFGGTDPEARSVLVQPDGKVVLAGTSSTSGGNFGFALARLHADGSPDASFDGDGKVQTQPPGMQFQRIRDAVLLPDGRILAAGTARVTPANKNMPVLLRYTPAGAPDAAFDGDGLVATDIPFNEAAGEALAVQFDGKIVLAGGISVPGGGNAMIARYSADGQLDAGFGPAGQTVLPGVVMTDQLAGNNDGFLGVTIQADGRIVAAGVAGAGASNPAAAVARYDGDPPPVAVADAYSTAEDTPRVVAAPGVLGNDTLPPGSTTQIILVQDVAHGTLNLGQDGSFTYTPAADYNGPDSFRYRLDNGLTSETVTVSLAVTPVNDAPAAADDARTTAEDTPLTIDLRPLATDIDSPPANWSFAAVSPPAHGTVTATATPGVFSYTPAADYNGTDSFTYKVNDGGLDSNVATIGLTVTPVNDAPAAGPGSAITPEGTGVPIDLRPLVTDVDSPAATRTFAIVAPPTHGTVSPTATTGVFLYTPVADYNGPDSFTYQANDGALDSNVATITLTITPLNDAPVATDGTAATAEDTPGTIDLRPLVTDPDNPPADWAFAVVTAPAHGTLAATATPGVFTYTPAANYFGPDSFAFTANDGNLVSNVAAVSLTVSAANDAPAAVDGSATTAEDTGVPIDLRPLATDVDSPAATRTFAVVTAPAHGTLTATATAGVYTYLPAADYAGPDSFAFTASDGTADSTAASVRLTVTPVNDAPVAADGAVTTAEDTPATIDLRPLATDVDTAASALAVLVVTAPANGTLAPTATAGVYTYSPAANDHGSDALTFRVNDGSLDSAVATVTVTVTSVNDAPTAAPEAYTIPMAEALVVPAATGVLANDADADGDALTAVLVAAPATGALVLNPDGSFAYTPAAGFAGRVTFAYQASDGQADSPVQTVELTREPFVRVDGRTLVVGGSAGPDTVRLRPAGGTGVVVEFMTADGITRQTYKPKPGSSPFRRIEVNLAGGDDWFDSTLVGRRVRVAGGPGNDVLKTGNGADEVYGDAADGSGSGADVLATGGGNDTVAVGDGDNRIETGTGNDAVTLGDGANAVYAGAGNDTVAAGAGPNFIDAGAGNDLVSAVAGDNWLVGGSGSDVLIGGAGADRLEGGDGSDLVAGGLGADLMLGEGGNDLLFDGSVVVKNPAKDSLTKVLAGHRPRSRAALDRLTDRLTITADPAGTDLLTGGAGIDWFWAATDPEVTDLKANELLNGRG
jgi:uncharacterized delta-60 repeat protein